MVESRGGGLAVLAAAWWLALAGAASAQEDCLRCHGVVAPAVDPPAPRVDPKSIGASIHRGFACLDCHEGAEEVPHRKPLPKVACGNCHDEAAAVVADSVHGAPPGPGREAATCAACHGDHEIRGAKDADATTAPANLVRTCGRCHGGPEGPSTAYIDSVHGRAFLRGGLLVAATCVSCHSHHAILPTTHPSSGLHARWVADTCGKCHTGVAAAWRESVHGRAALEGGKEVPTCSTCHPTHAVPRVHVPAFQQHVVAECGTCHADLLRRYRDTYHGRATALGAAAVARCSDCHEAHGIRPPSDPASSVHPSNRHATCARCHEDAPPAFATYVAHPDYRNPERDPVLFAAWFGITAILLLSFGVFGLHTVLWLGREVADRRRGGTRLRASHDGPHLLRFTPTQRSAHSLLACVFFGLAATGLPVKYFDAPWAEPMLRLFGGIAGARLFHRFFALALFAIVLVFTARLVGEAWARRKEGLRTILFGPDSIVPVARDFRDFGAMFRWFLGRGEKPRFGRWIYFEKFEFWAILWGTVVIGLTGLAMWFPEKTARILPGWVANVALVIHSTEALLAVGMSLVVHVFNTSLRPGKFPLDPSMYTGKVPEAEIREDRPLYYERLAATGRLEGMRVPPPGGAELRRAHLAGLAAIAGALTVAAFIAYAYLG